MKDRFWRDRRRKQQFRDQIRARTGACATCRSERPADELNYEAQIHHNANKLECIDRKACERRKRRVS